MKRGLITYKWLLRLYPGRYHKEYSEQMLLTAQDMLDNASSRVGRIGVWIKLYADLSFSIFKEQLATTTDVLFHETPNYMKKSAIVSSILLLPFFFFLIINSLFAHRLYHTWVWSTPILFEWIVVLPALALLISAVVFTVWLLTQQERNKLVFWRNILDVRHNWPVLLTGFMGLFIILVVFGHDSVHCVMHNPVQEIRNWRDTLRCIQQG